MKRFITEKLNDCRSIAAASFSSFNLKAGAALKELLPFLDVGKGLLIWTAEAVAYVIMIVVMIEAVASVVNDDVQAGLMALSGCLVLALITLLLNYTHYAFNQSNNNAGKRKE